MSKEIKDNIVWNIYNSIVSIKENCVSIKLTKNEFDKLNQISLNTINQEVVATFVSLIQVIQFEDNAFSFYNALIDKLKLDNINMYQEFKKQINEKLIEVFSQVITKQNQETVFTKIFKNKLEQNETLKRNQSKFFNHPTLRNSENELEVSIAYPPFHYWQKLGIHKQCFFWKLLLSHPKKNDVIHQMLKDILEIKNQTEKRIFVTDDRAKSMKKFLEKDFILKEKDLLEALTQIPLNQNIEHSNKHHKVQKI